MKKISFFSITVATIFSSLLWAGKPGNIETADNGIHFENITFNHTLKESEQQHKLIFMNVYATWCAPCKMLMKNTFTSPKVGEVLNKKFVNISIDAEKGEGIALAKKYKVQAHPLMLIIDSKGKVVKRILGYRDSNQLLADVKTLEK